MRVLIASGNSGKVREFGDLLAGSGLEAVAPADVGIVVEVEETGQTYMENALLKARAYAQASGMPALADDSGVEVDALDGAPGMYSARYGGPGLHDSDRTALILERLAGAPEGRRNARYVCALALCLPDGGTRQAEGICNGMVASAPRGTGGFGYDPIFLIPELGRTMAELTTERKNELSHRARAVQSLLRLVESEPIDTTASSQAHRRPVA